MANPFSKGWKYLTASLDQKIDDNADPMVQIKQATDAAKKQHEEIANQAANIIGNRNQLEMKMNRLIEEQTKLTEQARTAINLADQANASGDAVKAQEYSNAAEIYASQLVSAETELEETKTLHAQAVQAAQQAQSQVQQSEARLKDQLAQIDQMRNQVNQTRMQEANNAAIESMNDSALTPDGDVPTLDSVRAKIEQRYANALGSQELIQNGTGAAMAEIDAAGTDMRAKSRLEEIRASMAGGNELENDKKAPQLEAAEEPAEEAVADDADKQAAGKPEQ